MREPGPGWAALGGVCLAVAIASDLLDGRVARRSGSASPAGQLFDHGTDCIFVTAGFAAAVLRGALPWPLPLLVPAAFAQYVIDSVWLERALILRMSALGRWN